MPASVKALVARLGRWEWAFAASLTVAITLRFAAREWSGRGLFDFAAFVTGCVAAVRALRRLIGKAIWRLRNRLIVTYVFIGVIPAALLITLTGLAGYLVVGQTSAYLVRNSAARRAMELHVLARDLARDPKFAINEEAWPGIERVDPPAAPLEHPYGLIQREGRVHLYAVEGPVALVVPATFELLSELMPGLGDASFLFAPGARDENAVVRVKKKKTIFKAPKARREYLPAKYNFADVQVTGYLPQMLPRWEEPGKTSAWILAVHTRSSAMLRTVFGETTFWGQGVFVAFVFVMVLLLIVELVALVIGVSLTRTVTGAVHELYEGTERVKEGDFTHRIHTPTQDQIGELGRSFNRMTENLERLIVVEKERERLQSELMIAREVQAQLFPREAPKLKTLMVSGVCHPARMVSGDYYDFIRLGERDVALAIGDVAGKGISAALLMASIQSIMRTQLTAGVNGNTACAAQLVSQLNKQLYANTSSEKYATFYFSLFDDESGRLIYTNCGHLPPILLRDGAPELLEVTGTVVGAFPFARYEEKTVDLLPGDLLVAYTDGISEPENEYGEMFGEERLKDLVVKFGDCEPDKIIAEAMQAVEKWTGSSELQDDMTMVVARRI